MADKTPYGDVTYADTGFQSDGVKRYPLDSEEHCRAAWSYINQARNAAKYSPADLAKVKGRIEAALKKYGVDVEATEAPDDETTEAIDWFLAVREALEDSADRHGADPDALLDVGYDNGVLAGTADAMAFLESLDSLTEADPADPSFARTVEALALAFVADHPGVRVTESAAREESQVVEAKGTDSNGGRVFRVQILKNGVSRNGNRYTESVMRSAANLYEGAKAYDHHRTAEEMRTSTLAGLVGSYRNVEATGDGLYADLHLLPGATHTAEALDRAIDNQRRGLPPLVGISHDVLADFKPGRQNVGGRMVREATAIRAVQSADVVADPSAGGQAVHAIESTNSTEESEVPPTKADVLAAFREASDDELAAVGLVRAGHATESYTERVVESRVTEAGAMPKASWLAQTMINAKAKAAGLDGTRLSAALPDRVTEADVDAQIALSKSALALIERQDLAPSVTLQVTQESHDKKVKALDAFFAADYRNGYKSFREAFIDFTGQYPKAFNEDFNRTLLRESFAPYDSDGRFLGGERTTESMTSSTWNLVLGDSITRRMVAEYNQPNLRTWETVVSSVVPVNDFRTQRIDRIGGYGTLPAVNQGAAYQPLTSPTNEEATYAITKRGGTEDVTLEMVANDDVRAIQRIPTKLGLAAAQTLYRFVWDFYNPNGANANTSYDSTALYHANHANTASTALSQSNLSAARLAMRAQAAYGDTSDILSLVPRYLVVVNDVEEIAFQLSTSAVAIPSTPAGPSDTPNIHKGLDMIVVDYWSSTTGWLVFADPNMCPTFELGFYQGRQEPEIFTQSDQNVGSMFNADTVTYKIRHIYSGAVLDHRSVFRGNS